MHITSYIQSHTLHLTIVEVGKYNAYTNKYNPTLLLIIHKLTYTYIYTVVISICRKLLTCVMISTGTQVTRSR